MNVNDARIAALYTTRVGCTVPESAPNAYSPLPGRFDLILQVKAGAAIGSSGADYVLTIIATNDDCGVPVPGFAPKGSPLCEEWTEAYGWRSTGREFVKTSVGDQDGICRYEIGVPEGLSGEFHLHRPAGVGQLPDRLLHPQQLLPPRPADALAPESGLLSAS